MVLQKLKKYLELNGLSKFDDIKRNDAKLAYAIEKHGGFLRLKKDLGFNVEVRKSPHYWSNVSNLKTAISSIANNGVFPTVSQIVSILGNGAYKAIRKYGGIKKVAKMWGYSGSWFVATDGHYVQSSYEHVVDDILYHNGVIHDVGGFIPDSKYRYDFRVGDFYVEIWGYAPRGKIGSRYNERKHRKKDLYASKGLNLISIEYKDFDDMQKLMGLLAPLLTTDATLPQSINTIRHPRYWTFENTIAELKMLTDKLGRFPTYTEIKKHNGALRYGIYLNGGIKKMQPLFGVKPQSSWSDLSIKNELARIGDMLGHFPTTGELKAMKKTGLLDAIQRHGGIYNFKPIHKRGIIP